MKGFIKKKLQSVLLSTFIQNINVSRPLGRFYVTLTWIMKNVGNGCQHILMSTTDESNMFVTKLNETIIQ